MWIVNVKQKKDFFYLNIVRRYLINFNHRFLSPWICNMHISVCSVQTAVIWKQQNTTIDDMWPTSSYMFIFISCYLSLFLFWILFNCAISFTIQSYNRIRKEMFWKAKNYFFCYSTMMIITIIMYFRFLTKFNQMIS